jgi:hypothetical protein
MTSSLPIQTKLRNYKTPACPSKWKFKNFEEIIIGALINYYGVQYKTG